MNFKNKEGGDCMPDNNSCKTIDNIITYCQSYLHNEDNLNLIKKAYDVAKKKHEGQFRKSGDPYIQHPVEVAYILATLHAGPDTIAAGLLHDVLEDTDMSKEEMAATFNKDVAEIVDGVTKISKLKYMTKEKALAHNHEKLLLAMAKDIRVILVKIADRLHNMRTIQFHSEEKQKRIAKETLDLYAPLAHRLGMYRIKAELEDLSFKALEPEKYAEIAKEISSKKTERDEDVEKMISRLKNICMRGGFETVFVNMYYYDILHTDYAKYYLEAGFKIVTAGHQLDIYFLSRLKSIIELSDYTVSNSVGTHLGYCIWMNKPHYIIDDQIINETNERDYKKIGSFFLTYTEQIQPEQYAVVEKYWGFDSVRTSEELKSILK